MGCVTSSDSSWGLSKFSTLLYPGPVSSAHPFDMRDDELLWVSLERYGGRKGSPAKAKEESNLDRYPFPCRILYGDSIPQYLMIFFHKNADDLSSCKLFCDKLNTVLGVHVLAVEYPGYGFSQVCSPSSPQLLKHAFAAINFVEEALKWPLEKVIVLGASIGSGPALAVAAENPSLGGLALIAPFYNLKSVVWVHAGPFSRLVEEQFPNNVLAPRVECQTFIIHGDNDKVVPLEQGRKLFKLLKAQKKELLTPHGIGHNDNLTDDHDIFLNPMKEFFKLPKSGEGVLNIPAWAFDRNAPYDPNERVKSPASSTTEPQVPQRVETPESPTKQPLVPQRESPTSPTTEPRSARPPSGKSVVQRCGVCCGVKQ